MTSAPFARAPTTSLCTFGTEAAQRGRRCVLHVWFVKSITSSAVSAGARVAALSAGGGGNFALPHSSMTVCAVAFVKKAPATIAAATVMVSPFWNFFIFSPMTCLSRRVFPQPLYDHLGDLKVVLVHHHHVAV